MLAAYKLVIIALADACSYAKDESCLTASTDSSDCALIDLISLSTAVALLFQSLDTDERRDIACFSKLKRNLIIEKCPICKELEIAILMPLEDANESFIHQGFAAKYAEEF
jgi:hypothetical protein